MGEVPAFDRAEKSRPRGILADEVRKTHGAVWNLTSTEGACDANLPAMGILGKLSTLIKSNVNDVIDSMQDPGKAIDQMVRDMEESARQARTEVGQCLAEGKRLERKVTDLDGDIAEWDRRAEQAVKAGDDGLAKEALRRKGEKEAERTEMRKAVQEQSVYTDQLAEALRTLDVRLKEIKLRQGTLKAKARANRGGNPASTKTSAFDDFDRMANRIDAVEAEASLNDDLAGRSSESVAAERRLNEMAEKTTLDDALAELKKKLGDK
jgi:phage shock protein A